MALRGLLMGGAFVALLLAPPVVALAGTLVASGSLELPAGARLDLLGPEIYVADAASISALTLRADHLRVMLFDVTTLEAGNLQVATQNQSATYTLTFVTGSLDRTAAPSWMGTYSERTTSAQVSVSSLMLSSAVQQKVGNMVTPEREPEPIREGYARAYSRSHLTASGSGITTLRGDFAVKLQGIDIDLDASENRSTLQTTSNLREAATARHQWAYLEFVGGELAVRSPDLAIVATEADASWEGRAIVTGATGELRDGVQVFDELPSRLILEGAMGARVSPRGMDSALLALELRGDLASTNANARIALPAPNATTWGLPLGVLVVALALASGLIFRRVRSPRVGAQTWQMLADEAASRREFGLAAEYLENALKSAPRDERLLCDRAFFLAESGQTDEAIQAYKTAAEASRSGEAEFLLARLYASLGDDQEAVACTIAALRKSPLHALELESDTSLSRLTEHPEIIVELREAARRLGERR